MPDDSAATVVPPSTIIPFTHPQLNELQDESPRPSPFITTNGVTAIAESYLAHLSPDRRDFSLSLHSLGLESQAEACIDCGAKVIIDKHCSRGRYGHGYIIVCHNPMCPACGQRRAVFGKFLRNRDLSDLIAQPQVRMELFLPLDTPLDGPRKPLSALAMRAACNQIAKLAAKFLRRALITDAVSFDQLDPDTPSQVRLRMLMPYDPAAPRTRHSLDATWKLVAGPLASLSATIVESGPAGREALEWAFAGLEPALLLAPVRRADLRYSFLGKRLARTYGRYYAPLSKQQLAERSARLKAQGMCPVCKDDPHPLDDIPRESQCKQAIEEAASRYEHLDLSANYDPFRVGRGVVNRGPSIHNSSPFYVTPVQHGRHGPN